MSNYNTASASASASASAYDWEYSQSYFQTWANAQVVERKLHLDEKFQSIRYGGWLNFDEGSWALNEEEVDHDLLDFYGC